MLSPWLLDPVIQATLHAGLAALFATAAWHKWRQPESFRLSLAGYALLPDVFVTPVARTVPLLEASLAVALLVPGAGPAPAAAAGGVLALYALAMAVNLARGRREIDCGCGVGGAARPIGVELIARNTILVGFAAAAAPAAAVRGLGAMDVFTAVAAVAAAMLLYTAVDQALQNARNTVSARTAA